MPNVNNAFQYLKKIKYGLRGGWHSAFEINKRAKIDVFDYQSLVTPLNFYPFVPHKENNLYGNGYVINKEFSNIDLSVTAIEHGLYIGSLVPERHLVNAYHNIITFSEYRKKYIEAKTDKNIITIGPYIKYAKPLYSDEKIALEKELLGKTLVVFPSHSIESIYAKYDINQFIEYIKKFKNEFNFDKVLVCLYWKDIALGMDQQYVSAGFNVVSAGHMYDPYFLSRLKTILLLADATLTNTVGTHVGYAITLNKPTKVWNEGEVGYHPITGNEAEAAKELGTRTGLDLDTHLSAVNHIKDIFSNFDNKISNEQVSCVQHYWGS